MTLIRQLLVAWILNFFALWVAITVVGSASATGTGALVLAAAVFGLLNIFVKPVLMLIGLPFRIITFGLVTFLINMLMVAITAGRGHGGGLDRQHAAADGVRRRSLRAPR